MNIRNIIFPSKYHGSSIRTYKEIIIVDSINDIPSITQDCIYIVQRGGKYRWAVFQCPCGSKERIEVNLMKKIKPCWKLGINNNKVSLWPSIVVENNSCHSHFWLIKNKAYMTYERIGLKKNYWKERYF